MKEKILHFLERNNIEYLPEGPNVKKNNVNIACPFCKNDPSFHMGISLLNGEYACWRNGAHRGKSFTRVIQALIHCTKDEARRLLGLRVLEEGEFDSLLNSLFKEEEHKPVKMGGVDKLAFDKEFRPIKDTGMTKPYWDYLEYRGFDNVERLIAMYGLKCALVGYWKYRIIFPVYFEGQLVTWVGRSITSKVEPKYLDLSIERSVRFPKYNLWNYDELLNGGKVLYITEGIFDAIKLDFYFPQGYKATCLFTKTIMDEQQILLKEVAKEFKEVRILLDADAQTQAMQIKAELSYIPNITLGQLPEGVKDPGELNKDRIYKYLLD